MTGSMPSAVSSPTSPMADVQGAIQAAANELVASGAEIGLLVAVLRNGRVAAEAVSGVADPRTGAPVRADTLFYAASTAKGVAASLAHVLAERGDLDYDMTLAQVWPEFGSLGKDQMTVRHVLLHTAGLPGLPPGTTAEDLCDWDSLYFCTGAAEQKAVNLRGNSHVILMTGTPDWESGLDVVVEGEAVPVTGDAVLEQLARVWTAKWDGRWQFQVRDGAFSGPALVFSVKPAKVLAFAKGGFSQTRHTFS